MKKLINYLFFTILFSGIAFSQQITGIVFDSVSLTGLSLAPNITGIINVNDRFFAPKFDQFLFAPALYTSYSNISGYKIFEKKDNPIMGIPIYKLYIEEYLRSSPNNLKAMIQLPALLKPGKKARH